MQRLYMNSLDIAFGIVFHWHYLKTVPKLTYVSINL